VCIPAKKTKNVINMMKDKKLDDTPGFNTKNKNFRNLGKKVLIKIKLERLQIC
jgi:hypothetical protein